MDTSLSQLRSSRECTQFAEQAEAHGNAPLAAEAHQRAITLLSEEYGATTTVERAIMAALHEYERALRRQGGGTHSGYLRRMLKQSGIVPAIDHLVGKEHPSTGYHRVLEIGRADLAFEAVVLRYPGKFSPETVEQARNLTYVSQTIASDSTATTACYSPRYLVRDPRYSGVSQLGPA